jgi:hypothetical protein
MHSIQPTPRCGNKSIVKLLLRPGDRGVGIDASAHTTVVDVVDEEVDEDVLVEEVVDEEDVVVDAQVELTGEVVSTADAGAI